MCGYLVPPRAGYRDHRPGGLRDQIPSRFTRAFEPPVVRQREDYYLSHLRRPAGEFSIVDLFDGLDLGRDGEQDKADNLLRVVADIDPASVERVRVQLLDAVEQRVGVHFVVLEPVPGSADESHSVDFVVADSGSDHRMVIAIRLGAATWLWRMITGAS
jgi:hypothetical protein